MGRSGWAYAVSVLNVYLRRILGGQIADHVPTQLARPPRMAALAPMDHKGLRTPGTCGNELHGVGTKWLDWHRIY